MNTKRLSALGTPAAPVFLRRLLACTCQVLTLLAVVHSQAAAAPQPRQVKLRGTVIHQTGTPVVTGELKTWHCTTITFAGPAATEKADPHPFLDYRLNVTFAGPAGQTYVVPGYFAADGNAGESGATAGNKWRVHFMPDKAGQWSYVASLRTGKDVAVDLEPSAGDAVAPVDGAAGTFIIAASDKTERDFRGPEKGLIANRGHHYLTFAGGDVFLKGGPDIPENFLGYTGFDNTPSAGHDFDVHQADWNSGDPDWDTPDTPNASDGRGIIGALNFIADHGGNSIYFLPMNIGGDGKDTFPTIGEQVKTRYDVSKLDQWEQLFGHATRRGIFLHFQLAETEAGNENYHDGGNLGPERKLYYRELIARFGHHPGLEWNLGEENDYGTSKRQKFAAYIKAVDPYDHPVTTHIHTNKFDEFYGPLLSDSNFDLTSFQATESGLRLAEAENEIQRWRRRSAAAGVPLVISVDEPQKIENDKNDEVDGYPNGRMDFMWPIYLSGGGGFEWYVQKDGGGHGLDQRIDDFRQMEVALQWTGYARQFLTMLPLLDMQPDKSLGDSTAGGTTYVLHKPGEVYALYNDRGGEFSLDLSGRSGTYEVKWFDPRNGGPLQDGPVKSVTAGGIVSIGQPPNNTKKDWAAVVRLRSATAVGRKRS